MSYYNEHYSDWLSDNGIEPVELLLNETWEASKAKLDKVDGILLTGGTSPSNQDGIFEKSVKTKYFKRVIQIYQYAKQRNDSGNYFMIYGTCLGSQSIINSINQDKNLHYV